MRKKIIWFSIFIPGMLYLMAWLLEGTPLEQIPFTKLTLTRITGEVVTSALVVIGAVAYGIGLINVFRIHLMSLLNRKKGWQYSLVVFVSFMIVWIICVQYGWLSPYLRNKRMNRVQAASFITVPVSNNVITVPAEDGMTVLPVSNQFYSLTISNATAILPVRNGMVALPTQTGILNLSATNIWAVTTRQKTGFDALFFYINYINLPLVATIMALLGFYITYAAYRAFKIRSVDGVVMMSVAVLVMIGYDPLGNYLTHWLEGSRIDSLRLPVIAQFLKETMNGSVFRSLNIGIYIATIAISWRIWLGLESQLAESE
jgi:hypothetical protein